MSGYFRIDVFTLFNTSAVTVVVRKYYICPLIGTGHTFHRVTRTAAEPECLDWLIPFHERHLRGILHTWVMHYNRRRPHASLGPGVPEPSPTQIQPAPTGHCLPTGSRVVATPVLNGLHHEYHLIREAA